MTTLAIWVTSDIDEMSPDIKSGAIKNINPKVKQMASNTTKPTISIYSAVTKGDNRQISDNTPLAIVRLKNIFPICPNRACNNDLSKSSPQTYYNISNYNVNKLYKKNRLQKHFVDEKVDTYRDFSCCRTIVVLVYPLPRE